MAHIEKLWLKLASRGPLSPRDRVRFRAGHGIEDDANAGTKRQVTIIDRARWSRAEEELGRVLDPAARRANVLISGLDLADTRGRLLRLGTALLRVGGETTLCRLLDDAEPGLCEALRADWGGGAWAEVLEDGEASLGDEARWEDGSPGSG